MTITLLIIKPYKKIMIIVNPLHTFTNVTYNNSTLLFYSSSLLLLFLVLFNSLFVLLLIVSLSFSFFIFFLMWHGLKSVINKINYVYYTQVRKNVGEDVRR